MARRRKNQGLGSAISSSADLYRAVKKCGSPYFDPATRRFFNSRVLKTFPVEKHKATYYVEAIGGGRTPVPRVYRVGVFKNCTPTKLGAGTLGKTYKTAKKAEAVARQIVGKARWG